LANVSGRFVVNVSASGELKAKLAVKRRQSSKPDTECQVNQYARYQVKRYMRESLFGMNGLCHTWLMRQVGQRIVGTVAPFPSGEALRAAAVHQATGQALAAVATSGIPKGIYRFSSPTEMNRHTEEAMVRAVALNVRRRLGHS